MAPTSLTPTARALAAKEQGNAHFKAKDYAQAVGCYSQAHLLDPKSPIYPLNRAQAYLNLLKYDDAERDCTTSIGLDGTNSKAWFRRAVARREMKNFEGAARDLFEVLKLDSKQEVQVKAEQERLKKEQGEFAAKIAKKAAVSVRPTASKPKSDSSRPQDSAPIPIPITMVYPSPPTPPTPSPTPPPAAPSPAPPLTTFKPDSSSPLPEILAVPVPAFTPPAPSPAQNPPSFKPSSDEPLRSSIAVPTLTSISLDDNVDELEESPRSLLSSTGADPTAAIFPSPNPARSQTATPTSTALPPATAAKTTLAPPREIPTSVYGLQSTLTSLAPSSRLPFLLALPPQSLASIISSSLEPPLLDLLLAALSTATTTYDRETLKAELERVKRFKMVLMMTPGGKQRWSSS